MREKLGDLSQEFLDMVYPAGYVPGEKPKPARKRQADSKNEQPNKKVGKTVDAGDMKALAEGGKVSCYFSSQSCTESCLLHTAQDLSIFQVFNPHTHILYLLTYSPFQEP